MPALAAHASNAFDQWIEWLGVRFCVPHDWQLVRHGLRPQHGSLVFVDRRVQRLTVSWTECRSEPDLERLLSDYRAKLEQEASGGSFKEWRSRADRCLEQRGPHGVRVTRAVRYHAPHRRLLEIQCVASDTADDACVTALLDSLALTDAPAEARRVCAFGLDVLMPVGFVVARADVKPFDATLHFAERDGTATATLRRLGMVSRWHHGELEALAHGHFPRAELRRTAGDDHAVVLTGREAGALWLRLFGRLRLQRTVLWLSPTEDAAYELTTWSRDKHPVLPDAFAVRGRPEVPGCS